MRTETPWRRDNIIGPSPPFGLGVVCLHRCDKGIVAAPVPFLLGDTRAVQWAEAGKALAFPLRRLLALVAAKVQDFQDVVDRRG